MRFKLNNQENHTSPTGLALKLKAAMAVASVMFCHGAMSQPPVATSGIEQGGAENSAVITQENVVDGMFANILQAGTGQEASIYQSGPVENFLTAEIEQSGSYNIATIDQSDIAIEGAMTIFQNGNENLATAIQSTDYTTEGVISQIGDLNRASLYQTDTDTIASISQEGTANVANVDQSGAELWTQSATVRQVGMSNTMNVLQDTMGENLLDATQIGQGNYADFLQRIYPGVFYGPAVIQMMVNGDNNAVLVTQQLAYNSEFVLDLKGNENRVEVLHNGGDGTYVDITSHYSNNNFDLIELGGAGVGVDINRVYTNNSNTDIEQVGYSVGSGIVQEHVENANIDIRQSALASRIEIRQLDSLSVDTAVNQDADESMIEVKQSSATNSLAIVTQNGSLLAALIYQTEGADLATAEIVQTNVANTARIDQMGASNSDALITQTGISGNASIVQTSLDGGEFNSASITQAGENYSAAINQDGSYNTAAIVQM